MKKTALVVFGCLVALVVSLGAPLAETGFRNLDPNDPIKFTADRLEVKREGRVAAFIGNVEAIQGDLNVKADTVKVYYRPAGTREDTDDDKGGFGGAVSRIDTSGHVRISSRGDLATGDWAVYDIERRIVTMGGAVSLQRGETVLKGSRLELDLESGRSRVQSASSMGGASRVEGEFVPSGSGGKNE